LGRTQPRGTNLGKQRLVYLGNKQERKSLADSPTT
jgi:hypothetical protein